jgi:hypothetical protein
MQNFVPGQPANVNFVLVDEAGAVLVPTALRFRVVDEAETELQPWTPVTVQVPAQSQVTVTVLGALNILTPPATRGIRTVFLEVTAAGGTYLLSESVMLSAASGMTFGVNSFQTYSQALLLAEDFVDDTIPGWYTKSRREDREKALIQAYTRIMLLPIALQFDDTQSILQVDGEFAGRYGPIGLRYLTPSQLSNLYQPMLAALKRAQLLEADTILAGDEGGGGTNRTLISKTVGESSEFYRQSVPLDLGVSQRTLKEVQRWVRFTARIHRG